MLSPKRCAQLGLGAACLVLVTSVTVLVAGAGDLPTTSPGNRMAPLVNGPVATVAPALPTLASAKR